ncbi:MAG: hypothetical protein KGJ60_06880 [Verrucomicrobiota bacterium]|nr:hypothetical protein [Verrucomicrobiota bacterium]
MRGWDDMKRCAPLLALAICGRALEAGGTNAVAPVAARDFYNAGTELLAAKHFAGAEEMFQSALAAQEDRVQPPALYNLGHARFDDGMAALKSGPSPQSLAAQGNASGVKAGLAIRRAESALAENQLSKMVAAYLGGLGARRELDSVEEAVRQAMKTCGDTLDKWRRAEDDFKGAAELNPADTNAVRNAQIVGQYIDWLVDSLRQMQHLGAMLGERHHQLNEVLRQIGGRIPEPDLPPGAPGGDQDEDGGMQPESLRGLKEEVSRAGKPIGVRLSPDEAKQILEGISVDDSRQLPMNETRTGQHREKSGFTW